MQTNNVKTHTPFTSLPMHHVNVRTANNSFKKVVLSQLDPKDVEGDLKAVQEISKTWSVKHALIDSIENEMKCANERTGFFVIETKDGKRLVDKIIGLMSYSTRPLQGENWFRLEELVTKPEFEAHCNKDNSKRKIKGVGEILLAKAFERAKALNSDLLRFHSEANSFYRKTFKRAKILNNVDYNPYNKQFVIDKEAFDKYINYCQKKYDIDFSKKI